VTFALGALIAALACMTIELRLSRTHERQLLARGAVAPDDPAYAAMRWVYPGAFVAMALEGAFTRIPRPAIVETGILVFLASKLLKAWAIHTLGIRWTYRVFILPGEPLVTRGPYRLMRHPNYLAVIGELAGMAMTVGARVTGPAVVAWFLWLLRRRIAAEEHALHLR
jgi:methyltransferase